VQWANVLSSSYRLFRRTASLWVLALVWDITGKGTFVGQRHEVCIMSTYIHPVGNWVSWRQAMGLAKQECASVEFRSHNASPICTAERVLKDEILRIICGRYRQSSPVTDSTISIYVVVVVGIDIASKPNPSRFCCLTFTKHKVHSACHTTPRHTMQRSSRPVSLKPRHKKKNQCQPLISSSLIDGLIRVFFGCVKKSDYYLRVLSTRHLGRLSELGLCGYCCLHIFCVCGFPFLECAFSLFGCFLPASCVRVVGFHAHRKRGAGKSLPGRWDVAVSAERAASRGVVMQRAEGTTGDSL